MDMTALRWCGIRHTAQDRPSPLEMIAHCRARRALVAQCPFPPLQQSRAASQRGRERVKRVDRKH
jgi:hypothetical protein